MRALRGLVARAGAGALPGGAGRISGAAVRVHRGFADVAKSAEKPAAAAAAATVAAVAPAAAAVAPAAAAAAAAPAPAPAAGDKTATSPKVGELCDRILELNVLEINQLLFRLQTRLGISDAQLAANSGGGKSSAPAAAAAGAAPAAAAAAPPKDAFDIKLGPVDAKAKIKIIKEIRVITGLGLAESKALVEKAPCVVKQGVKKDEVDKIKKLLVDAGATVEVI